MKKIRNIKDIEQEKLKLRVRQLELEKQMDHSWKELRNNLSSNSPVAEDPGAAGFKFKTGSPLLNGALSFGAGFLSYKFGALAGRTVGDAAEKIIGKLGQKVNSLIAKKKRSQKS
jgi:hypothetical protein